MMPLSATHQVGTLACLNMGTALVVQVEHGLRLCGALRLKVVEFHASLWAPTLAQRFLKWRLVGTLIELSRGQVLDATLNAFVT